MNPTIQKALNQGSKMLPDILTGIGCAGIVLTAVSSAVGTTKAVSHVAQAEEQLGRPLDNKEIFKTVWKDYIFTVVVAGGSVAAIIASSKISGKRLLVATAAGTLAEMTADNLKEAIIDRFGPEAYDEVVNGISQYKINSQRNEPNSPEEAVVTFADGKELFLDGPSGRYFYCSKAIAYEIQHSLNCRIEKGDFVSLNDIYEEFLLPPISIGDDLGWDPMECGLIDFEIGTAEAPNGKPCFVLNYLPTSRYRHYYGG